KEQKEIIEDLKKTIELINEQLKINSKALASAALVYFTGGASAGAGNSAVTNLIMGQATSPLNLSFDTPQQVAGKTSLPEEVIIGYTFFGTTVFTPKLPDFQGPRGLHFVRKRQVAGSKLIYYVQDNIESPIIINDLNNSVTQLLGITPNEAIKKKFVYAKASKPRYGPIGYDEIRLTYNDPVLYLLKPGELEGGRRHATDMNWSPQIYYICESLAQKDQSVLY
ncbi:hypothetical protein C2G38_2221214, partial [Gigaspora rosea]